MLKRSKPFWVTLYYNSNGISIYLKDNNQTQPQL